MQTQSKDINQLSVIFWMTLIFVLGHLTKMATMPIYGKTKYVKLTLTYFIIIKEIRWALQDLQVL